MALQHNKKKVESKETELLMHMLIVKSNETDKQKS